MSVFEKIMALSSNRFPLVPQVVRLPLQSSYVKGMKVKVHSKASII
ncbi:hypothetical protein ACQCVP_10890 [Rossellomorea vietnamensis]